MADEDDWDLDDSLLAAVENVERQHAAAKQHQAPPAPPQQQHGWQQQPQPPPAQQRQHQPLQQHNSNVQQQHQPRGGGAVAAMPAHDKIWGLFCSQPLAATPTGSRATGWAGRRLQQQRSRGGGAPHVRGQPAGWPQQQQQQNMLPHVSQLQHQMQHQMQPPAQWQQHQQHQQQAWAPSQQQQQQQQGAWGMPPPPMAPLSTAPQFGAAPAGGSAAAAAVSGAGSSSLAAAAAAMPPPQPPPPLPASSSAADAAAAASGGPMAAAASGGPAGDGAASGGSCVYTAKLTLGPQGTVEVRFSGHHKDIAAICGGLPGARRAPGAGQWTNSWLVAPEQVAELQQALSEQLPPSVRVSCFEPLPDLVRNVLAASRRQPDDSGLFDALSGLELAPGESLEARMMPFQREGVRFGLKAGGRLLIGDEMGLGKTVQACALAKCYQAEWPVLVVAPSSLRLSWAAALYDWLRVTEDRVLVVLKGKDMLPLAEARSLEQARKMYDFVIVSYDLLKDTHAVLAAVGFNVIILDESHCIKNGTAQRTKLAKPLVEHAARAILLSGTPALSRPGELLTQLQVLLPKARLTKKAFEERYVQLNQYGNMAWSKATGSKNEDELNRLLTSTVMIRRRKAEVLHDLPAKMRKQVPLLLSAAKRQELDRLKAQLTEVRRLTRGVDEQGGSRPGGDGGLLAGMQREQQNMVMRLWHDTARIKAPEVCAYVGELLLNSAPDDKFLVFAFHKELLTAIEEGVNETRKKHKELRELRYMRIDGSTDARSRDANVAAFQNDASCRVAILNIKAAGVGLTLTRASTVVFAELAWTPSEMQQAEDRAHRIGQTQSVSVHLLICKDSIDELMWETLQAKLATTGQVLDGQAGRMEVDRSSMPAGRGRGGAGASGGGPGGGGRAPLPVSESQQPSITTFFTAAAAAPAGGGGGGSNEGAAAAAAKKQRVE